MVSSNDHRECYSIIHNYRHTPIQLACNITLPGEDTQDTVGSSRQFLPLISTPPCQGRSVKELPAHAHFSVTDITVTLEHLDIESNPHPPEDELQHPAQAGEYCKSRIFRMQFIFVYFVHRP